MCEDQSVGQKPWFLNHYQINEACTAGYHLPKQFSLVHILDYGNTHNPCEEEKKIYI